MTEKASENLKAIWKSAEMDHVLLEFFVFLIACILGLALAGLPTGAFHNGSFWSVCFPIFGIFCIPMLIFTLWRAIRICRKPACYVFSRCILSQACRSDWRNTMYFTVVLEDAQGDKFVANTHAIFRSHGLVGPLLEDYINQTVTVGYNEETEQVVVIG